MTSNPDRPNSSTKMDRWARFRFSIIGQLLSDPPDRGELCSRIEKLSARSWDHPIEPGEMIAFGTKSIERWYYAAKNSPNPIQALRHDARKDSGIQRALSDELKQAIRSQHRQYPDWTINLHYSNLKALVKKKPGLGELPSYSSVRRFMRKEGLDRTKRRGNARAPGAITAEESLERREVRSFEADYVGGLWHLDFHTSRMIGISKSNGEWVRPHLLGVMDDRSRLCCHAQFYLAEATEELVHGFSQALLKRGLPRSLLSDNGGPMISAEFTQGLERLSILHKTTLPYSPHQNGKQENFWAVVESQLLAMLSGKKDLTLGELNRCLQAWIEQGFHSQVHSETKQTPRDRFYESPNVLRESPSPETIRGAFRQHVTRKIRRSDVSITIEGKRFEVPSVYRHLGRITVAYARWDLSLVHLIDPKTGNRLARLWPIDKSRNAEGQRRSIENATSSVEPEESPEEYPPLLKQYLEDYAQKGRIPGYIVKDDEEEKR